MMICHRRLLPPSSLFFITFLTVAVFPFVLYLLPSAVHLPPIYLDDPTANTVTEFKEIRKEWKARKKEEENARKADEERARQSMGGQVETNGTEPSAQTPTSAGYPPGVRHSGPQLPPIGYGPPGEGPQVAQYQPGSAGMYQQSNGQMYSTYPHSPYTQGGQVYPQRKCTVQTMG
jgi:hypothetical protein